MPDTSERNQQELGLQIALGGPLIATKGYASLEARQAYVRARELCQQLGDTPQLFLVLSGLFSVYGVAGEHKMAHGLAAQLLSLAQRQHAPTFFLTAHYAFGLASFYLGEPAAARKHLEQGIALYDPQKDGPQVSDVAQDLGVVCRVYTAWTLWFLGYPDQALKTIQEALTLARELDHPHSLAHALDFVAILCQFRGEGQTAQEQAELAISLCTDQGFPFWLAKTTILQGYALAEQGQGEAGIARIRQGLASFRATGAEVASTYYLALLAETYGRGGHVEEGLRVVDEALAIVDKNEERYYEAELYRLKGALLLNDERGMMNDERETSQPPAAEAEACFHKAIDIARSQEAKSLELRAAMSLSRLWQSQGKKAEAHQLLRDLRLVYGRV